MNTPVLTRSPRAYIRGTNSVMCHRVTKTLVLFFSWICLGLYNEVIGPTLSDLKARVNSDYEQISRVLSARSAGLFVGSLTGGLIYDRFARRRDLILAASLILSGVTIAAAPWCSDLWILGVLFHLMGQGHALLTTGGNPTLAFLWAEKASGPYNFLHSGFGFGAAIGPLISGPFLSADSQNPGSNSTASTYADVSTPTNHENASSNDAAYSGSRIEYPYLIVGVLCAAVAFVFLIFYLTRSRLPTMLVPDDVTQARQLCDPARCVSDGDRRFGCRLLGVLFVYYLLVVGGERMYGKFIFSYAVDSRLAFSKRQAGWLNSAYWVSFTAARCLASIVARWIPIHVMLLVETGGTLLAAAGLDVFHDDVTAFWILTSAFGLFKSPLFPSGLGWANGHVRISSMTITCVNVGSSVGGMIMQWLTGYLFQYYGPRSFLHLLLANSAAIFALFLVMHLMTRSREERHAMDAEATSATRDMDGSVVQLTKFS